MTWSQRAGAANDANQEEIARAADLALTSKTPFSEWTPELNESFGASLATSQFALGRFLLWTGLIVTVASIAVDFLTIPQHAPTMVALRLALVIPLQVAALAMPIERLALQKALMGLSIVVFAGILLYGAQWAPPLTGAYMAIGPVLLLGVAAHVLPYSPREVAALILGFTLVTLGIILVVDAPIMRDPAFLGILLLTVAVSLVLPHRMWQVEAQSFLYSKQSEHRLRELEQSNLALIDLSRKDPLTGLANRRHATEVFGRHYDVAPATGEARVAVMMIDIDHFKAFNDRWGHQLGDECLRAVAEELRHCAARNGGLAARFGGEEFVVVLRADSATHARQLADELRVAIERIEIQHEESAQTATLTTSIGIALHDGTERPSLSQLLGAADAALYQAKANGRNRSEMAA